MNMVNITMYGKPSYNYEFLKSLICKQTEKAGISIELKEINDVNSFIDNEVSSIPAVKINGELMCRNSTNILQFGRTVSNWILKKEKFGNMKKIIVPIDLVHNSEVALNYALSLNAELDGVVKLVHIYHPTPIAVNGTIVIEPELEKIRRKELQAITDKYNRSNFGEQDSKLLIESEFILGGAAEELINISKEENTLIIMESVGKNNKFKKLFGSVSIDVAKKAQCPILVIPKNYQNEKIRKIAYCTSKEPRDASVYKNMVDFASLYNSQLHLIHYNDGNGYSTLESLKMWENFYPKNKIIIEELQGTDKINQINNYCEKHNIDLLAMSTENRPFLENIFHKSTTKQLMINTRIPLLILHKLMK